jgi:hypothetical protein
MKPATFAIDFLEGSTFEGYTQDEDWNGFACPYFSLDQAQHLVEVWNNQGWSARYDSAADTFMFEVESGRGEKEWESYIPVEIEGLKLYPVGSFNWIWEEVGNESGDNRQPETLLNANV